MDRHVLLFLAAVIAGYALISIPLGGTVFAPFSPIASLIGILAVIIFAFVIIFKAVLALIGK